MADLITAIGPQHLTEYFKFLDNLRDSGAINMFGAAPYLRREYGGMTITEARQVLRAWQDTRKRRPTPTSSSTTHATTASMRQSDDH